LEEARCLASATRAAPRDGGRSNTTSFNWAETNFAAVWLRQFWFVLSNSAITDVQNGGLTFVTGGDYTRSSVIDGVWSVAEKSAFVGHTQPAPSKEPNANPYANPVAADVAPFNPRSGLQCPINDPRLNKLPNHCIEPDSGVDFEVANFATNQRLFSIYDGPSYQDANAYLDITPSQLSDLDESQCQKTQANSCPGAMKLYGRLGGRPKDAAGKCYLPNASIGWKQPNGFFYPPAFHSQNLYEEIARPRTLAAGRTATW
jgi:cell migration-inducing and hyaluronan-binding protein